jgi:hypothetical protein
VVERALRVARGQRDRGGDVDDQRNTRRDVHDEVDDVECEEEADEEDGEPQGHVEPLRRGVSGEIITSTRAGLIGLAAPPAVYRWMIVHMGSSAW